MEQQAIQVTSSGSDMDARYAMITDEKKRKRMLSNRESARRSRLRRQKQIENLVTETAILKRKIQEGNKKLDLVRDRRKIVDSENSVLKAEKIRLANYMTDLEIMIMNNCKQMNNAAGCDGQSSEIMASSEYCRRPWQVRGTTTQPIISPGIFKF